VRRCLLIGLLAAVALPGYAGIRTNKRTINSLEIDGVSQGRGWSVSAPTLRSSSGYLSYDVSGKSPQVTFRPKSGRHARWTFVEERRYQVELPDKGDKRGTDLERTGWTMKLQAAEGPFAGWYLGRVDGTLSLVKDPRKAAKVLLVEREADIEHK